LYQHPFKDNVIRVSESILAAVMTAPRQPIELREFPRPDLPAGAVLLKTSLSEVCGTDVHLWHGRLAGVPYPIIPGHVSAGVVDAARGPVTGLDGSPIREGDRVVFFDVHRTCGRCRACTVHRTPTRCAARRVYGITDSANEGLFGGWARAIYLEPGVGIARLPDAVALDDYIGGGCGLLTAVHIAERAEIRLGDTVVVQGVGAVGLSAIALARIAGASRIIAIGAPQSRLALASEMGADLLLELGATTPEARRQAVLDVTHGEGADVVIEAAGAAAAISEGLDLARAGGRYVIAGHYTDVGDSNINAHQQINRKHLEIRGCWGSEARHFLRALSILERHPSIPFRKIGARRYALHELNDALADAEAMLIPKALVDPWQ
jgi:threonine dehydrogenase-like Zn-dependent dehydrogenase